MIIENKKAIVALHLSKFILLTIVSVAIVVLLYFEFFSETTRNSIIWVMIGMYVLYFFWDIFRNHYYFYYSDTSLSKLLFRYYSLVPFFQVQKSIEIKKELFHSFRFESKMFGLRHYIVLYQLTSKGVAQYPPISVSLLSKKQKESLIQSLAMFQKVSR